MSETKAIIERALKTTLNREMISALEVQDLLLDLLTSMREEELAVLPAA